MSSPPVLPDGWRLVALDSVGSTNDEAARLADAGAPEGTVVWAREQTGGRGRRGRRPRHRLWALLNAQALLNGTAMLPGGVLPAEDDRRRLAARQAD